MYSTVSALLCQRSTPPVSRLRPQRAGLLSIRVHHEAAAKSVAREIRQAHPHQHISTAAEIGDH